MLVIISHALKTLDIMVYGIIMFCVVVKHIVAR